MTNKKAVVIKGNAVERLKEIRLMRTKQEGKPVSFGQIVEDMIHEYYKTIPIRR